MSTSMADSALGLASLAVLVLLALAAPSLAGDPDMLQDICVADYKSLQGPLRLNGFPCKRPENVTVNDFFFDGLTLENTTRSAEGSPANSTRSTEGSPANSTRSTAGSSVVVTAADVDKLPGLNTQGVSMARIDYAPGGLNPPHTHPRATEIVFVLEGTLDVGFVTTANRLFARTVRKGEVFVFPRGLLHFQKNSCPNSAAVAIAAFSSQTQGTLSVADALFGATPPLQADVLAEAFQIDSGLVDSIKFKFQPN